MLGLLLLHEDAQSHIASGRLTREHGHVLRRLVEYHEDQRRFAGIALARKLTARKLENLIREELNIPRENRQPQEQSIRSVCREVRAITDDAVDKVCMVFRETGWGLNGICAMSKCPNILICRTAERRLRMEGNVIRF
jgi:hypothetical protein